MAGRVNRIGQVSRVGSTIGDMRERVSFYTISSVDNGMEKVDTLSPQPIWICAAAIEQHVGKEQEIASRETYIRTRTYRIRYTSLLSPLTTRIVMRHGIDDYDVVDIMDREGYREMMYITAVYRK